MAGCVAGTIGLLLLGLSPSDAAVGGLACGVAGAAVEAVSTHGVDNLTTQLAGSAVAWLIT